MVWSVSRISLRLGFMVFLGGTEAGCNWGGDKLESAVIGWLPKLFLV